MTIITYKNCQNYQLVYDEIKRCNARVALAKKEGVFFNSALGLEKDKENIINSIEFVSKICEKIFEALSLSNDCMMVGPPEELFSLRKNLKNFCKERNITVQSHTHYFSFDKIYREQLKKFKRRDSFLEEILKDTPISSNNDKILLSNYVKSINSEFLCLQQQCTIVEKALLVWFKKRERIRRFGNYEIVSSLILGKEFPLSLCSLLKQIGNKNGKVTSQQIIHIKDILQKRPEVIENKEDLIKWFYTAMITYLDMQRSISEKDVYKLVDMKYREINARYCDLVCSFHELNNRIHESIANNYVLDLSTDQQAKFFIQMLEWKSDFLQKRIRIFNDDFIETTKKYSSAIKKVNGLIKSSNKLSVASFVNNEATFFINRIPIRQTSELYRIDVQQIRKSVASDPLLLAYEDIIQFLDDLPTHQKSEIIGYEINKTYQSTQNDAETIEELNKSFSQLQIRSKEPLLSLKKKKNASTSLDSKFLSSFSYHPRVARWFDNKYDFLNSDAKYMHLKTDELKEKVILFHNFSSKADYFVLRYGLKNDLLKEYPESVQYALPCIIKTNITEYRGKVIYCVDKKTNTIWHRCFKENGYETFRTDFISDTIWIKDVDFPVLMPKSYAGKQIKGRFQFQKQKKTIEHGDIIDDRSSIVESTSSYVRIHDSKNQAEIILDIE